MGKSSGPSKGDRTYPFGIKQRLNDTSSGDQSDRERVVVVVIDGPKDNGSDLEDVERVQNL